MVLGVSSWYNGDGEMDNKIERPASFIDLIAVFISPRVTPIVRATQITATLAYIIFVDSTIRDVILGAELFPSFKQKTLDDKVGCMLFSSILRLSQSILAIMVTFLLIVSTSTVIEIILNFTVVNFISTLDDVGFAVIKWGNYGKKFKKEADRIEKLPLPKCINRKHKTIRCWRSIIPIGVILMSCLCYLIFLQEGGKLYTNIFRVQFQDNELGLHLYNGCYKKNETAINMYDGFEINTESAKFGYCMDDRNWILFRGNISDACAANK
jgi:hypothetical protein